MADQEVSVWNKVAREIRVILLTSFYFLCWFGALVLIKKLLLLEYNIEFIGLSLVVVGALVVSKVVLILENVSIPLTRGREAWKEVLLRTLLYLAGVFVVMALEKSIEARHEYDGVFDAFTHLWASKDMYHVWVNTICVFGALLFFNIWTVVKKHHGKDMFSRIMKEPVPPE